MSERLSELTNRSLVDNARKIKRRGQLSILASLIGLWVVGIWMFVGELSPLVAIFIIIAITMVGGLYALSVLNETWIALSGILFLVANLYLQIPAVLYVLTRSSFLNFSTPEFGMAKVVLVSSVTVFSVLQVMIWMRRSINPSASSYAERGARINTGLRLYAIILVAVGLYFIFLNGWSVGTIEAAFNYQEVSDSLRGRGVAIRLSEFAAIGGILLAIGHGKRSKWFWVGVSALIIFSVWRAGFGNRENAVRYFIVWILANYAFDNKRHGMRFVLIAFIAMMLGSFLIPWAGVIRSGLPLTFQSYLYLSQRDFGMVEVAGNLAEGLIDWTPPGVTMGVLGSLESLLPRFIFPDKQNADAVTITDLTTSFGGYDLSSPQFAYAPSYIGQDIFWWPDGYFLLSPLLAVFVAYCAIRLLRNRRTLSWRRRKAIVAMSVLKGFVVYALFFSAVKIDFYNLAAANIIGVCAIIGAIVASTVTTRDR